MNSRIIAVLAFIAILAATSGLIYNLSTAEVKTPPVPALSPNAAEVAQIDWCAEHRAPESECTKCHPDLVAKFKEKSDWCGNHGVPESHCNKCNADLKFPQEAAFLNMKGLQVEDKPQIVEIDWCSEHRAPESECAKCHPDLVAKFKEKSDWCANHGVPESHCYKCNTDLKFPQEVRFLEQQEKENKVKEDKPKTSLFRSNKAYCETNDAIVQLASLETAGRAGIVIEVVSETPSAETIEVPAEVMFNAENTSAITTLVKGTLVRWVVQPGERVVSGQVLAFIESIEAATMKAEFVRARTILQLAKNALLRKQTLAKEAVISTSELEEAGSEYSHAEADAEIAASSLYAIGYDEKEIAQESRGRSLISVKARQAGVLVEQTATLGTGLESGGMIGIIAETDRLWIEARVRERDIARVALQQKAEIVSDGIVRGAGKIIWIADSIDPLTRMGKVRIETDGEVAQLKSHQFVTARIAIGAKEATMFVSTESVQWEGCCNVVFVEEAPGGSSLAR